MTRLGWSLFSPRQQVQNEYKRAQLYADYTRLGGKWTLAEIQASAADGPMTAIDMLRRMIDQLVSGDSPCYEGVELIMPEPEDR